MTGYRDLDFPVLGAALNATTINSPASSQSWTATTSPSLLIAMAVGFVALLYWRSSVVQVDSQEPPLEKPVLPVIGHLIGILYYQIGYLTKLSLKVQKPIYTISIFGQKIYIVTSPPLIAKCLGNKAFASEPVVLRNSQMMFDLSPRAMEILSYDPPDPNEPTYLRDANTSMFETLQPGPSLYKMNGRLLGRLSEVFNEIGTQEVERKLYGWVRDSFTIASGDALYGSENPFAKDASLIQSIWDYEEDLLWLMPGIASKYVARKAHYGRIAVQRAFCDFYEKGYDSGSSTFTQGRANAARRWGFTNKDLGFFEVSIPFVSNTNSVPSGFWLLTYILADPALTASIRTEIAAIASHTVSEDGKDEVTIDISKFATECPLLVGAYNETLRLADNQSSVREVTQDTLLDNTYVLKKGALIQMPSGVPHLSPIWGADAASFDATRFIKRDELPRSSRARKAQTQGYFPFGGGKHLCPGRYFAFNEIVGLAAMLLYGFEVRMKAGGEMKVPAMRTQKFGVGVKKPAEDVDVCVKRRVGFEDVRWRFACGEAERKG